jgi:FtsZ-interacting cell division protein ZipA
MGRPRPIWGYSASKEQKMDFALLGFVSPVTFYMANMADFTYKSVACVEQLRSVGDEPHTQIL